jgi:membrane-associated protein
MEWFHNLYELLNGLDHFLGNILDAYGMWVYPLLFAIIFAETGFIVTPFLPGDSLLFAIGLLARKPENDLNVWVLFVALSAAAILGNTVNYHIAKFIGVKVFEKPSCAKYHRHIDRAHELFDKYGGWALIIARFIPFARALAPFVAGISQMSYFVFQVYNVIGAVLWVGLLVFMGYFVGRSEVAQNHTVFALLVLTLVTVVFVGVKMLVARVRNREKTGTLLGTQK